MAALGPLQVKIWGRVYFLDQMNPRPIFEIAPSFAAFLNSFEPRPEVE